MRYVYKALASTFFAKTVTRNVDEGELQLLDKGLKSVVKRLRNGMKIEGDATDIGLLVPSLDQLMSYKDTTYRYRNRTTEAYLYVGGIITPILVACDVNLDSSESVAPTWIDIPYLKKAKMLNYKEAHGMYIYKFDHPEGGESTMLLPSQAHTTI